MDTSHLYKFHTCNMATALSKPPRSAPDFVLLRTTNINRALTNSKLARCFNISLMMKVTPGAFCMMTYFETGIIFQFLLSRPLLEVWLNEDGSGLRNKRDNYKQDRSFGGSKQHRLETSSISDRYTRIREAQNKVLKI